MTTTVLDAECAASVSVLYLGSVTHPGGKKIKAKHANQTIPPRNISGHFCLVTVIFEHLSPELVLVGNCFLFFSEKGMLQKKSQFLGRCDAQR